MFSVHNTDVKKLTEHFNRLQKAIAWLSKDPQCTKKLDTLLNYFISSDDLRRNLHQTKVSYRSYDADIYFMRLQARFNNIMDDLKKLAYGQAFFKAKHAVQEESNPSLADENDESIAPGD